MTFQQLIAYMQNPEIAAKELGSQYQGKLADADQFLKQKSLEDAEMTDKLVPGSKTDPMAMYNNYQAAEGLGNVAGMTKAEKVLGQAAGKTANEIAELSSKPDVYESNIDFLQKLRRAIGKGHEEIPLKLGKKPQNEALGKYEGQYLLKQGKTLDPIYEPFTERSGLNMGVTDERASRFSDIKDGMSLRRLNISPEEAKELQKASDSSIGVFGPKPAIGDQPGFQGLGSYNPEDFDKFNKLKNMMKKK